MKTTHGMLCSIWQVISTMVEESPMTGIEFAYFLFWRNTTTNRWSIMRSKLFLPQNYTLSLNILILKHILNTFKSYLTSKILKSLACMKTQTSHIRISNLQRSWRRSLIYSQEYQLQQVENLQIRLLWIWLPNSPLKFHSF